MVAIGVKSHGSPRGYKAGKEHLTEYVFDFVVFVMSQDICEKVTSCHDVVIFNVTWMCSRGKNGGHEIGG